LIGVTIVTAILGHWMAAELLNYGDGLFRVAASIGRR
jgi:flagellar biosynthesis protein FliQ